MIVRWAIFAIRAYQSLFSSLFPASCRYKPTCSQYSIDALSKYGLLKGLLMSARRVLRCHPFHPGGYDPIR